MNQKDAVFQAVVDALGETPTTAVTLTDEQRKSVVESLTNSFLTGEVEFSADSAEKYSTESAVRSYARGVLSNYLRRDTRLNGGGKYQPVIKGPRAPKDEQIANMKALKKRLEIEGNTDGVTEVEEAIQARATELQAIKAVSKPKAKTVSIDLTKIPEDLRASLNITL